MECAGVAIWWWKSGWLGGCKLGLVGLGVGMEFGCSFFCAAVGGRVRGWVDVWVSLLLQRATCISSLLYPSTATKLATETLLLPTCLPAWTPAGRGCRHRFRV